MLRSIYFKFFSGVICPDPTIVPGTSCLTHALYALESWFKLLPFLPWNIWTILWHGMTLLQVTLCWWNVSLLQKVCARYFITILLLSCSKELSKNLIGDRRCTSTDHRWQVGDGHATVARPLWRRHLHRLFSRQKSSHIVFRGWNE